MQNNKTEWYIKPIGPVANEIIARSLTETCDDSGNECIICDEMGNEHKCWRVEHSRIADFMRAAVSFKFQFEVYVIEPGRPARQYFLHTRERKSAKVKKVLADLEKIKNK